MKDLDIKKIREKLGISQEKLAEMVGVHARTVQNWERGTKIPSSKHAILRNLQLNPQIFAGGEEQEQNEKRNIIPFYDTETIGGINECAASTEAVTSPTEYIDTGDWFRDATAAIRHYGDSMVNYPSGCILALKEVHDRELIIPGNDYVIETSEYRVTKRVQRGATPDFITAYSTNMDTYPDGRLIHEPFDIPLRSITRIFAVLGYVVKKAGGTLVINQK